MIDYQRFLTQGFKPYNPLELAKKTEQIVTKDGPNGLQRKNTNKSKNKPKNCLKRHFYLAPGNRYMLSFKFLGKSKF